MLRSQIDIGMPMKHMPVKHCSPSQLCGKLKEIRDLPSVPGKPAKSIPGNGMVEVAAFHELSDQHGLLPLQAANLKSEQ